METNRLTTGQVYVTKCMNSVNNWKSSILMSDHSNGKAETALALNSG